VWNRVSEFGSEIMTALRQIELVVAQTRSMWSIFCTEFIELYSSFLTE